LFASKRNAKTRRTKVLQDLTLLNICFNNKKSPLAAKKRCATSLLLRSDAARCGFTEKVLCTDRKRERKKKKKKKTENGEEVSRKSCAS